MSLQLNVATRNARLDTIESTNGASCSLEIRSGAQPADCATAGSGTILATINLPADWMANAASGSKAKSGTWQDASADNNGTAGHFRLYNSQATKDNTTCFMQGSVTATGGGGDMTVDNTSFAAGQQFTVTGFTLTDGNA
jgi:hypothetical protein